MKIPVFLKVNGRTKSVELRKNPTQLNAAEIMVQVVLDVPDVLFTRPIPTVTIQVPEDLVSNPDPQLVTSLVADDVALALGLDFKEVQDGLIEMMKAKAEEKA